MLTRFEEVSVAQQNSVAQQSSKAQHSGGDAEVYFVLRGPQQNKKNREAVASWWLFGQHIALEIAFDQECVLLALEDVIRKYVAIKGPKKRQFVEVLRRLGSDK